MEKFPIERLSLLDMSGHPATLRGYFQNYALLIFLRHLA
jgi:hypothetical protein